jgi:hypothetical protein
MSCPHAHENLATLAKNMTSDMACVRLSVDIPCARAPLTAAMPVAEDVHHRRWGAEKLHGR